VRWKIPAPPPLVSLIIPTRDRRELLEPCVESLLAKTGYRNFELIVVDNESRDPAALDFLASLERRGAARVLRDGRPFNFSALNNLAVAQARGEIVGLLNNDLEVVEEGWLEEMTSHAMRPEVGAVGARLLYPDRTVQHAGVILGIGGIADHAHKHLNADAPGYTFRARLTQNVSAVTAACLLIRKQTYLAAGGLDEQFAVAFNDVDFCLRVRALGLRNLWTPFATLIHHESKSRGRETTPARMARFRGEIRALEQRWGKALLEDPAYNPNLTLDATNFSLAWPPRVHPPWRRQV
jgi:GT2 family glycosyltransferase